MCCSVLQCVSACSSVFQCVPVCCRVLPLKDEPYVLQCVAVCCSVLPCVAVCCSVLQCVVLQCDAVCCSVLRLNMMSHMCCSVLQCVAVCCSMSQCVASGWKAICIYILAYILIVGNPLLPGGFFYLGGSKLRAERERFQRNARTFRWSLFLPALTRGGWQISSVSVVLSQVFF